MKKIIVYGDAVMLASEIIYMNTAEDVKYDYSKRSNVKQYEIRLALRGTDVFQNLVFTEKEKRDEAYMKILQTMKGDDGEFVRLT